VTTVDLVRPTEVRRDVRERDRDVLADVGADAEDRVRAGAVTIACPRRPSVSACHGVTGVVVSVSFTPGR
jgi:hypothetical protein